MVTPCLKLQSHTPFISASPFWREAMQICLIPGSKSASHSSVTGGSQTGRLVEPGFLSCCQGATASYWLIATASPSCWKSFFLLIPLTMNLSGICSCCEQGCCGLAELCCGLLSQWSVFPSVWGICLHSVIWLVLDQTLRLPLGKAEEKPELTSGLYGTRFYLFLSIQCFSNFNALINCLGISLKCRF